MSPGADPGGTYRLNAGMIRYEGAEQDPLYIDLFFENKKIPTSRSQWGLVFTSSYDTT